jgi:hypothetical protein
MSKAGARARKVNLSSIASMLLAYMWVIIFLTVSLWCLSGLNGYKNCML